MKKKKVKLNKKETNKTLESLLGFYQVIASIYEQGHNRFEDKKLSAIMIKKHIFEIINFHKAKTMVDKILMPQVTEIYDKYVKEWNAHIITKEAKFSKIIKDYIGKKKVSYIS